MSAIGIILLIVLLAVGGMLAVIRMHRFIHEHPVPVYRALAKFYPGVVHEVLRRRRRSLWYKTSQSAHDQKVWGYVDRHSIDPGESFRLMLSTAPGEGTVSGTVEIYRIGSYGDEDRRRVWQSDPIEVPSYGINVHGVNKHEITNYGFNNTAAVLGPNWPPALIVQDTHAWESGYYSIDFLHGGSSRDADIAYIVATDPKRAGDVLVKLATATYQAYNRWGGQSLYLWESPSAYEGRGLTLLERDLPGNRGDMVSFDRPTRSEFWEWEYQFVCWLEQLGREEGFSISYATNFDTTKEESFTSNYKLFISLGHDEYWSKEEFDRTYDRIFEQGGNTLFLGCNIAYWQVRYVDVNAPSNERGRQLICYKSLVDPIRDRVDDDPELHVTARFREAARRPETMLLGVGLQSNLKYRCQTEPRYAYYVENTDFPFFEGTGYKKGDFVAGIIGHEWDNRDPEAKYRAPGEPLIEASDRLWHEARSRMKPIPEEQIQVVFAGDVVDTFGRKGRAEAVYFESPAGAKVFSAGTIRWSWGLSKEGYVQNAFRLFNRNLITFLLRGDTPGDLPREREESGEERSELSRSGTDVTEGNSVATRNLGIVDANLPDTDS